MKVITIQDIREREADPQVDIEAQRRADIAAARVKQHAPKMAALAQQAERATSHTAKFAALRALTAYLEKAVGDVVPCKDRCSQCCHIPVLITQAEADVIGKQIKRKPAKIRYTGKANKAYTGQPCTFLKDDRCSIYENRPYMCRVHYSMDRDNLLCHIFPGETIRVPYLNNHQYQNILFNALGLDELMKIGDVRDFFPKGKPT